jgi:hypothetical protein
MALRVDRGHRHLDGSLLVVGWDQHEDIADAYGRSTVPGGRVGGGDGLAAPDDAEHLAAVAVAVAVAAIVSARSANSAPVRPARSRALEIRHDHPPIRVQRLTGRVAAAEGPQSTSGTPAAFRGDVEA